MSDTEAAAADDITIRDEVVVHDLRVDHEDRLDIVDTKVVDVLEADADESKALRSAYLNAFDPLRTLAATRHVMSDTSWSAALADPALTKFLGYLNGKPVGIGIATNQIGAVDWLSEEFFADRYPRQTAAGSLWYILTVSVDPSAQRSPLFRALANALIDVVPDDGAIVFDVCSFNASRFDLGRLLAGELTKRGRGASGQDQPLDVQTFYGVELGSPS